MLPEEVTDFFLNITKETIISRESNNTYRPDMISLLMEARKGKLRYDIEKNESDTGFATAEEISLLKDAK